MPPSIHYNSNRPSFHSNDQSKPYLFLGSRSFSCSNPEPSSLWGRKTISDNMRSEGGRIIMIDYNDRDDPNYDPYWGDKEANHSEPADCPDLSDFEIEELEEAYVREMREEGLLRPTLVKPAENKSEQAAPSRAPSSDDPGDLP